MAEGLFRLNELGGLPFSEGKLRSVLRLDTGRSLSYRFFDDEAAANKMDTPLILVFYMGCCVGLPMSVIALVLAIMNWIDKRKSPDQFFVTEEGSVIVTRSGEVVQLESELSESTEPDLTIESEQKFQTESDGKNESPQAQPEDWEWWDEG